MAKFSKSDYKYFDLARRAAEEATYEPFRLGCVMVYKGHVISTGSNSHKTHPVQERYNKKYRNFKYNGQMIKNSLHSEIDALTKIPYPLDQQIDYSKVKVYVYRLAPGLPLKCGCARPCASCMAALKDKGIQHIYYTTDSGFSYERIF